MHRPFPPLRTAFHTCLLALCLAAPLASAADLNGQPLPDVSLPAYAPGGAAFGRAQLLGKVSYIDFWASWCAPCRASFPWLDRMQQKYGAQGFQVLGINKDSERADAERFLAKFPVGFTLLRDPGDTLIKQLGVMGMPTAYLVDRQGVIRLVHKGFRADDSAMLEKEIQQLLAQP